MEKFINDNTHIHIHIQMYKKNTFIYHKNKKAFTRNGDDVLADEIS